MTPAASARLRSAAVLGALLLVVFANAAVSGWATSSGVRTWYADLAKPAWTPPGRVFGPAWTFLYTAMAIAAWRVWRHPAGTDGRAALLRLWWVQLALNAAWSWAFFFFRSPAAGLAVIAGLLGVIAFMQPRLARLDRPAALLWAPYVLWVAFAAALNLAILSRN